ncbi:MAG: molybdenum cofactor biosynthesis protein MoaE [Xanthomonadales bacterium]|jgi:molybdopterin synthase catalytic subunit|nr:molybdenum cofactor biosynthesis protein MoaE [Xanthomonadales bacterium]
MSERPSVLARATARESAESSQDDGFFIVHGPIDLDAVRAALEDQRCGAAVFFEGRVRDHNEGRQVDRLEYEVYEPLSVSEGRRIIDEARERWSILGAVGVHRGGLLELGDIAVVVGVVSPHRDEAFQAARYIIDEAKQRLPIWKREHYTDGDRHWVNCRRCSGDHAHPPPGDP